MDDFKDLIIDSYKNDYQHPDGFEVVESGEWVNGYKDYDVKEVVIQHQESGRFFNVTLSRSGSYYHEYEHAEPSVVEVRPVQVTVTKYEVIK